MGIKVITKFKIGDKVKGKKEYQKIYTYTSYRNGGYGIVTAVYPESEDDIRVTWVGGKESPVSNYSVKSKYFELMEQIKFKGNDYVA